MEKAIILAAGQGTRLRPRTKHLPKTMLEVGGETIIERILTALAQNNVREVIIVTGHKSDKLREFLSDHKYDLKLKFIHSEKFESTNNIYSLWLARDYFDSGFLIINSDTIFNSKDLAKLIDSQNSSALIDGKKELTQESMKVKTRGQEIIGFGKEISGQGEYIGVSKISSIDAEQFKNTLNNYIEAGEVNEWYETALNKFIEYRNLLKKPVEYKWIEIDDYRDYEEAQNNF